MKQLIKNIASTIIVVFSFVFSPGLSSFITNKYSQLYTFWLLRQFKRIGPNVFFAYPMYLKGGKYIKIGSDFNCDHRLRLDAYDEYLGNKYFPEILIGDHVSIQKDCHIGAINKIVIGNNVLMASKVYISDHSHGEITLETLKLPPAKRPLFSKGPVIIEDNVWLGEGVVVLPGVTIGENSIVGANAVVTKSIPKNSVAAGNPARIIREII
jgi:acetyltransferase-like isoleucine patch superfamily enzyme